MSAETFTTAIFLIAAVISEGGLGMPFEKPAPGDSAIKKSLILTLNGIYFAVICVIIISLVFIVILNISALTKICYSIFSLIFLGVLYFKIKLDRQEIDQLFENT